MTNGSLDELTQRLSTYTLNRDLPSSAPVTPPTQAYYDPRSRASTLTESSPPLQALQKEVRVVPQHYLTPPSEGQASPANLAISQSLPVSRRNSNTELMRVGQQDLSVIFENGDEKYLPSLHLLIVVRCISQIIESLLGRYQGRRGLVHPLKLTSTMILSSNGTIVYHQNTCLGC